jgi:hypothetical protein
MVQSMVINICLTRLLGRLSASYQEIDTLLKHKTRTIKKIAA